MPLKPILPVFPSSTPPDVAAPNNHVKCARLADMGETERLTDDSESCMFKEDLLS